MPYDNDGYYKYPEKLLFLIQGSGRARVGIWSCSLCINAEEGWRKGTMKEYIQLAHKQGYAVVVANPNESESKHQCQGGEHCFSYGHK